MVISTMYLSLLPNTGLEFAVVHLIIISTSRKVLHRQQNQNNLCI